MAVPLSFAGLPIYLHAPDFYASELGVSLVTLGLVLLVLRVVDAVQDPIIGVLSDRWRGHRRTIILFGVALLAVGFWMIFHPATDLVIAWFAAAIFICTTGYSVVAINFQALGGLWHAEEHQRTLITGWREGLGLVGLLAAALAPTLLGSLADPAGAFNRLTLLFLPLLAATTIAFLWWLARARFDDSNSDEEVAKTNGIFSSPWLTRFFAIVLVNGLAAAVPAVLVIFFIRDRLDLEADTGLFLLLYFLSGALAMPVWQRISRAVGKQRAWGASMVVAILTFFWAFFLGPGDKAAYMAVCVLSGLALGADLSLPPSILADYIAEKRSQASASRYFSILTFLSKSALALATGLVLPALGLWGYQPGAVPDPASAGYLNFAYALVPCAIKAGAVFWLVFLPEVRDLRPDAATATSLS